MTVEDLTDIVTHQPMTEEGGHSQLKVILMQVDQPLQQNIQVLVKHVGRLWQNYPNWLTAPAAVYL